MTRMVTQKHLNSNGTLFGGQLMKWMDETAFIAATRYSRNKMVTYSVDSIQFKIPIQPGTFVDITSSVKENTGVRLRVCTKILVEGIFEGKKQIAVESCFTFVCLNENGLPQRIEPNQV
jgi:acyl-CoA hydrolase